MTSKMGWVRRIMALVSLVLFCLGFRHWLFFAICLLLNGIMIVTILSEQKEKE